MVGLFLPLWCLMIFVVMIIVSSIIVVIFFALDELNIVSIRQRDWKFTVRVFLITFCILVSIVAIYYLLTPFYLD